MQQATGGLNFIGGGIAPKPKPEKVDSFTHSSNPSKGKKQFQQGLQNMGGLNKSVQEKK